jgi:hypothetical protein
MLDAGGRPKTQDPGHKKRTSPFWFAEAPWDSGYAGAVSLTSCGNHINNSWANWQEGEMVMSDLFFVLAILSVAWGIVSAIVITSFLSKRGIKINFLFFRVLMLKYVHEYHKVTMQANGKPGLWFYSYIISMNLALVFAIVGIVLKKV